MKKRPCVWRLDERTTVSMPRKRNTWVDAAFETGNGVLRLIVCSLSEMCRDRVNRYKWGRESFLEDTYWNAFPGSWRPLRCRAREVRRRRHLATTSQISGQVSLERSGFRNIDPCRCRRPKPYRSRSKSIAMTPG